MADREYDLVLYGATGFVGRLIADYLVAHAPADCRWAIAGRDGLRLRALRASLGVDLPFIVADAGDPVALRALAESARVVITTVGPYLSYGEPLAAACAAAGTDYVDLTGEPEFVDTMYVRHHETALATGARLVHSAGFDSVPHDLGAYFTVLQLPADEPITIEAYVRTNAAISGGTFASALTSFSRPKQNAAAARERRAMEQKPAGRSARHVLGRPHRERITGGWAVPLPTIDPQVVVRSARAVERYGPSFAYSHYASVPHLRTAVGGVAAVGGVVAAAQIRPLRERLGQRLQPGEGPSPERRARSRFSVTFHGRTGSGASVVTEVSGGDPGYNETAKMISETALSLAYDDNPRTAGQVTTVAACGDALLARLQAAGLRFGLRNSTQQFSGAPGVGG